MTAPHGVQLSRALGWRLPPNTVNVARPSQFGNPYKVGEPWLPGDPAELQRRATPEDVVEAFEDYMAGLHILKPPDISALRGKNLACWCPLGTPCHRDVLLRLANR